MDQLKIYSMKMKNYHLSISDNDVLIDVKASGVNRPDVLQRLGLYYPPPGASLIPGLEVSGKIVKIGKKLKNLNLTIKFVD